MQQLENLIEEARQSVGICNSCRYCEGFCAVFPALEQRLDFTRGDLHYLANLCHNCSECYYACQYAPPHEFNVNLPAQLAAVRKQTYQTYAWPGVIARGFEKSGLLASLLFLLAMVLLLGVSALFADGVSSAPAGQFYAIFPHGVLVTVFGAAALWVLLALGMGFRNFLNDMEPLPGRPLSLAAIRQGLADAFSLRYLHGNVKTGCTYPDDEISPWRRRFHHFTFYGFMLCFAATVIGTIFHYLFGWQAPYAFFSLPKLSGTIGGVSLAIGTAGQFWLKRRADPAIVDLRQMGMDYAFITQLFLAAVTGLALMLFRETAALAPLLVVHLAVILSLFVTMPFGKFVHGLYRVGALVKYAKERA